MKQRLTEGRDKNVRKVLPSSKVRRNHITNCESEGNNRPRAPPVVRPPCPYRVTRGFPTIAHLFEPQHHDSRHLRRVIHARDVVPPLPATPHGRISSKAFGRRTVALASVDQVGHFGHNPGTPRSQRPRFRHRRRPQPPRDADALGQRDRPAARSFSMAQTCCDRARHLRDGSHHPAAKAVASFAHSVARSGSSFDCDDCDVDSFERYCCRGS